MQRNLKRIFHVLQLISFPVERQKRLIGFLAFTNNEKLESIATQCERTPEWLPTFLDLLEKKFAALCVRDRDAYQRVIEEEILVLTDGRDRVHAVGSVLPNDPVPWQDEDRSV